VEFVAIESAKCCGYAAERMGNETLSTRRHATKLKSKATLPKSSGG
ncbi:hypothetical protein CCACVL1_03107, partial [Corchorus capsularis]